MNHLFTNRGKETEKSKSEAPSTPTSPDVQKSLSVPPSGQLKVKGQFSCYCMFWFSFLF